MAFDQGLSGLNAASQNLNVIGNNVANANTVGFKQSQAQFADVYANSLAGSGTLQVGAGTTVATVAQQFSQGTITATSNSMDIAISNSGFFRMDNNGAITYSRNGQFQLDQNGYMVNSQGLKLTGYPVSATGAILPGSPAPIQISSAPLAPKATVNVTAGLSLNANATAPATAVFNPTDPTSYNNSTSTTVFDSLGNSHISTMYFQRQPLVVGNASFAAAGNTMTIPSTAGLSIGNTVTLAGVTYTITGVPNGTTLTVTPPSAGVVAAAATTTNAPSPNWNTFLTVDGASVPALPATMDVLTFNTSGILTSAPTATASFTPAGAAAQTLTFNFATTTQYGTAFGVNSMAQDGYTTGQLTSFNTSANGTIVGSYTNGQTRNLGQVVLANFSNVQGLEPLSGNQWAQTATSGVPLVGAPGSSSLGVLQSGAVESSNVDLTSELVNMITAQRDYQANAQTIKTQDSLTQTLINLR